MTSTAEVRTRPNMPGFACQVVDPKEDKMNLRLLLIELIVDELSRASPA
jgi:hypothetical protein